MAVRLTAPRDQYIVMNYIIGNIRTSKTGKWNPDNHLNTNSYILRLDIQSIVSCISWGTHIYII